MFIIVAMDNEQINDLKHFIENTIHNQTVGIKSDISEIKEDIGVIKEDIVEIKQDISEMKQDIADIDAKADTIIETLGSEIVKTKKVQKDHSHRITHLESVAA